MSFDELWGMRLKRETDLERQRAQWAYEDVVRQGTTAEAVESAYRAYKASFTAEREHYAKRMWDWLESMRDAGGFTEQPSSGSAFPPPGARAYELDADGRVYNVQRFDAGARLWVMCADQEAEAQRLEHDMRKAAEAKERAAAERAAALDAAMAALNARRSEAATALCR